MKSILKTLTLGLTVWTAFLATGLGLLFFFYFIQNPDLLHIFSAVLGLASVLHLYIFYQDFSSKENKKRPKFLQNIIGMGIVSLSLFWVCIYFARSVLFYKEWLDLWKKVMIIMPSFMYFMYLLVIFLVFIGLQMIFFSFQWQIQKKTFEEKIQLIK